MVKLKDWEFWKFEVLPRTGFKGKKYVLESGSRYRRNVNTRVSWLTRIVRVVSKFKGEK